MQTLIAVIALAGSIASNNIPERPRWQTDYFKARSWAMDDKKPLAVFIGRGKTDWQMGVRDSVDPKLDDLLRTKYVCVFIDTETAAGKTLAADFAVTHTGLIISDRSGNSQQFHHAGELKSEDLGKALLRYADSNRSFVSTESLAQLNPPPAPRYQPSYSPPFRSGGT